MESWPDSQAWSKRRKLALPLLKDCVQTPRVCRMVSEHDAHVAVQLKEELYVYGWAVGCTMKYSPGKL